MEKSAFKMHLIPLLLIASLISLSHQYQTTTPQTNSDENTDDEVVEDTHQLEKRCYTVDEAADFCNAYGLDSRNSKESIDGLDEQIDLNEFLDEINNTEKDQENRNNWRMGTLESQNSHFLKSGNFSDVAFILGPENNTQIIRAHKMMLVRASPKFESLFNKVSTSTDKETQIRITDISPSTFESFLKYVYTGQICFTKFNEACKMLSVASKFQMSDLAKHCNYHLWLKMYPSNLWGAYQCAVNANDTSMTKTALSIIEQKTDEALMDSAFSKIPQSTLIEFLQLNALNVSSELALYEASLRWAMAEAERQGLPQEPDSLRACLGPALQHIRFLTLTPNEFANIQYTSKVLSYSESLAVIFNLNAPGVMPLPKHLSSNKNKRHFSNDMKSKFYILGKPKNSPKCVDTDLTSETSIQDLFPTTSFSGYTLPDSIVKSIKVPKRQNIRHKTNLCPYEDEDFTVVFLKDDEEIYRQQYKTECWEEQSEDELNSNTYHVVLNTDLRIPSNHELYEIKIIFNKSGFYPYTVSTTDQTQQSLGYYHDQNGNYRNKYETLLGRNNFVYSICNYK